MIITILVVVITTPLVIAVITLGGRVSEVRRLYRIGLNDRDIAKHMHMSVAHVRKITKTFY
jgi:DNA-binding NarL/FixJ family response regulator